MAANLMGEGGSGPLKLHFDRSVRLAFRGSAISSDGGLLLHRELDDALVLTDLAAGLLVDTRTGRNGRHGFAGLLRQSIYSRLAGRWIDAVQGRRPPKSITLDMDSSASPVHGEQEGAVWNGHFQSRCLHPRFVFSQFGDLERCALRPGNAHSADGWEEVLRPVLARYAPEARPSIARRRFCADAAFAIPALFDLLEAEGWDYAVRIKGNPKLHERIGFLTKRGPGRPPHHVVRRYTSFHSRAKSWSTPRRIVAKIEFHPGELFPTVGFIVTNRNLPNERVLAFTNGRGTAEQLPGCLIETRKAQRPRH